MNEFLNFVCWQNEAVRATAPRDAASLGDGHFQAVHHPLRLRRRRVEARSGGRWVNEQEIIVALQGRLRPDGYLLLPIVGGSGTGKSHLVRWVKGQTEDTPNWESRYLPKNRTGLRQAIDIITRGLSGSDITSAREALEAAPVQADNDDVLAERLLDELAIIVSCVEEIPVKSAVQTNRRQQQLMNKLEKSLPDVLRDPVVRRRLAAPKAVIPRLVGLMVRGRQDGDGLDDDATSFSASDIPLDFSEIGEASKGAQDLLRQLATIPDLKDATVELINNALPIAMKRLSVSNQVDLIEIFRDVRRSLFARDRELVLFIEDLTVLHGVEREFLDAIVEPARSHDGDMCNLRVIFAVTEGHFDDLDTVRSRCEDAYWLDSPYGEDGVGTNEALSFLGRYYNASRLSPELLEQNWEANQHGNWLPNACSPCPHQEHCHSTFGVTDEGYGLYPLNPAAAGRFLEAISKNHSELIHESRFDPREVVRELVDRLLIQGAASIRDAQFPSSDAMTTFDRNSEPISPLLAAEIQDRLPVDYERVTNTLRYWSEGDSPTSTKEEVLAAFGIETTSLNLDSLVKVGGLTKPISRYEKSLTEHDPKVSATNALTTRLDPSALKYFHELTEWAGQNKDLSASATNALRKIIYEVVVKNLELGSMPIHLGEKGSRSRFYAERNIGFVGTVTQQDLNSATIRIERNEQNAAALQGLLVLSARGDLSDLPETASYRRRVAAVVESWTESVKDSFRSAPSQDSVSAVEGLLAASKVAGLSFDAKTANDYIYAIFRRLPSRTLATEYRSREWSSLREKADRLIPELRAVVEADFGESRGKGSVRVIQAHRLLPIIEKFIRTWQLTSSDNPSVTSFMNALPRAVDVEWQLLVQRIVEATPLIDRERNWSEQTGKVLSVLKKANNAGRLLETEAMARLDYNNSDDILQSFFEAKTVVSRERFFAEKLSLLGSPLPHHVGSVHMFATAASQAIDGVERDLDLRKAATGSNNASEVIERVLDMLSKFTERAKELAE